MSHTQAWLGLSLLELPVQYIARYGQAVTAVSGARELAPPCRPQAIEPHQGACRVATHSHAALCHSRGQSAAAVSTVAGSKGGFEVNAGSAHHWRGQALTHFDLTGVVA